jgi:hypothetical protein
MLDNLSKHFQHCQRPISPAWVTKVDYSATIKLIPAMAFRSFPRSLSTDRRPVSGSSVNRFKLWEFWTLLLAVLNIRQTVSKVPQKQNKSLYLIYL